MTTETRDVLISAFLGLGFIFFFVSVFAMIWLVVYGVAKARQWWETRRGARDERKGPSSEGGRRQQE